MASIFLAIVVLGVALFLVETYIPLAAPLKTLLRVVVVLAIIWFLFRLAGLV